VLERTVAQRIETALERGDWSVVVDALDKFPDLRWGDLPPLNKKALAAFASKLPTDQQLQESLTASLFHPNRSVRLFARKILQSLKYPAFLAPFIRNKLDDYLRKTPALPESFKPDEAAQRRAQVETVKDAVAVLLKCDANEFLSYHAAIMTMLLRQREEQMLRWKRSSKIHEQLVKREEQIFEERFGHLGLKPHELPRRLQRELEEAILNDPECQRLMEEIRRQTPERLTLLEEGETVRKAFGDALDDLFDPKRKGKDAEVERVRAKLWEWVERGLRQGEEVGIALLTMYSYWQLSDWLGKEELVERGLPLLAQTKSHAHREAWSVLIWALDKALEATKETPLPETLTPEAVRALKIGDEQVDSQVERVAQRLEERLGKAKREQTDWWWEKGKAIAERFTTLEERLAALLNPSLAEKLSKTKISRATLLRFWMQSAGWDEQVAELREKAVPLLWERLREVITAWHALRSPKALTELARELTEPAKQTLTERELKRLLRGMRWEKENELRSEARDIFHALFEFDPADAWFTLLDEAQRSSSEEWLEIMASCPLPSDLNLLVSLLERFEQWGKGLSASARVAEQIISVIAEQCYGKWLESMPQFSEGRNLLEALPPTELPKPDPQSLMLMRRAYKVLEQTGTAKYVQQGEYAAVLYCWGTPEAMREVREILQKGQLSVRDLAKLALLRRDYDLIAPLAKQSGYWLNPMVFALWEELISKAPEKLPKVVAELLAFLAEATDAWQVKTTLEMLKRVADSHDLFAPHFNLLVTALDSTIPEVVQFAMGQLEKLVKASPKQWERQWVAVSERVREKLWSDKVAIAKGAVSLLSAIGECFSDAASVVVEALSEALHVNSLPLLELVLRGLVKIKASHAITFNEAIKKRLAELSEEHPERLGRWCRKLLS
jgi:hypothetical protein